MEKIASGYSLAVLANLSAIGGALAMLIALIIIANLSVAREKKPYEHVDFVSAVTQEDCFLCGNGSEFPVSSYWGEDNVAVVNLNTFEDNGKIDLLIFYCPPRYK